MGFWSRMLGVSSYDPAQRVLQEPYEPFVSTRGIPVMDPGSPLEYWTKTDVESFWRTQPNLRKVVGFVARGVASIPLHVHERVSDTERQRVTGHPLSEVLSRPQPRVGAYRFWESVISDGLLYDRWAVLKDFTDAGRLELIHLPSWRLRFITNHLRQVTKVLFWSGDLDLTDQSEDGWNELDLDSLIFDYGYAPRTAGLSPVETLRDLLDESSEAVNHRRKVWENGGQASRYIKRPIEAKWDETARDRFVNGLRKYMKDGASEGGTMLLEDGMELHGVPSPSSADVQDLEGRKLTAAEVASAYFVAPELVGAREGTYSNVDAFRQMTYRDSLGPYITAWEQAINVSLTPDLAAGRALYVEANVESKLRGSFIEQAQIMQSATGAPYLSRNEARALQNRPPIEGGDELVVPLNVLVGGQASPQDSGSQNRSSATAATKAVGVQVKAEPPRGHVRQAERVLSQFFARQGRSVRSLIGANESDWWDADRWDDELEATVAGLYLLTATEAGRATLDSLGVSPDEYDEPRTQAFLREAARLSAENINATTVAEIRAAIAAIDDDDEDAPTPVEAAGHVFEIAEESRAAQAGLTVATFAAGFGTVEAARQQSQGATKTWVVNSSNPRATHAALDGETVGIDEDFSNGLSWPGAMGSDIDEIAGCECSVIIDIPD